MEFRILGPLEIVDDGRPLELRGPKQRALLTILLLHANEVVSRERLLEDVWGERRPETAAKALHGYVSQLRKVLESTDSRVDRLLLTRAPGYELRLDPEQLDLTRFERLATKGKRALAAGDAEEAAATLREALSLWRGQPFAEFSAAPFAFVESLRLEELRLSATEDRIEADLALGRHGELVAELETLVAEHPHRERLWGYLMLALYRSGRQAEALEAYQRTRRALVDELGIEPGTMLQELERAILNHDPSLELPTTVEGELAQPEPAAADARRRLRVGSWRALVAASLVLLAVALGLALALPGGESAAMLLEPNSVGFIDAESGRVTKPYPVGREPSALLIAFDSLWVANFRDETVTRINLTTGDDVLIPVGGHPNGLTAHHRKVWVWTIEGLLVPIDPRYDRKGDSGSLGRDIARVTRGVAPFTGRSRTGGGKITVGGGFLWLTVPRATVIRVNPAKPEGLDEIGPNDGVEGAIAYRNAEAWVAGFDRVFPIDARSGIEGTGIKVGLARDLAFGFGSLWVVAGEAVVQGIVKALRRVDLHGRLNEQTIDVGSDPVAVAAAGGSIWVADRRDRAIRRVDPAENDVAESIPLGAQPSALAAAEDGIWVAVE
jgi:DNA-binding SARP family transcriptional activator/DNA-binding beta-propeller fold protein YncE